MTLREEAVSFVKDYFEKNGNKDTKVVIGISGGKDSSVVAALCCEALGKDRVIGVMMPNGVQKDISDSQKLCKFLGIKNYTINIEDAYKGLSSSVTNALGISETNAQFNTNTPSRLRMSVLYSVAALLGNARVSCNGNLSERITGFYTLWGDGAGDFAPLANYTATEVIAIGKTIEELPVELVEKAPSDGLCGKTDEDSFGFTYKQLDTYLRTGASGDEEADVKIAARIKNSEFKRRPTESCPYAE